MVVNGVVLDNLQTNKFGCIFSGEAKIHFFKILFFSFLAVKSLLYNLVLFEFSQFKIFTIKYAISKIANPVA